ncbi:MAG: hypothetical protein WAN65_07075 [Candidatus Sulfotelmatobacter sp.]
MPTVEVIGADPPLVAETEVAAAPRCILYYAADGAGCATLSKCDRPANSQTNNSAANFRVRDIGFLPGDDSCLENTRSERIPHDSLEQDRDETKLIAEKGISREKQREGGLRNGGNFVEVADARCGPRPTT